jgi:hypothetical protein
MRVLDQGSRTLPGLAAKLVGAQPTIRQWGNGDHGTTSGQLPGGSRAGRTEEAGRTERTGGREGTSGGRSPGRRSVREPQGTKRKAAKAAKRNQEYAARGSADRAACREVGDFKSGGRKISSILGMCAEGEQSNNVVRCRRW